ncbi:MAG TPA: hypothetical protein VGB87_10275, partial [Vicinamibacteria bacterium]
MARLAVFHEPKARGSRAGGRVSLRRRLKDRDGVEYDFFPAERDPGRLDPDRYAGALVPVDGRTPRRVVQSARRTVPGRPVGGLVLSPDARTLRHVGRLGLD